MQPRLNVACVALHPTSPRTLLMPAPLLPPATRPHSKALIRPPTHQPGNQTPIYPPTCVVGLADVGVKVLQLPGQRVTIGLQQAQQALQAGDAQLKCMAAPLAASTRRPAEDTAGAAGTAGGWS